MNNEREIPSFATEEDEAQWWFDNRDRTAEWLQESAIQGQTTSLAAIRERRRGQGPTPTVSIRIDSKDLLQARVLAERRGLRYQTYLKMILHEALEQETRRFPG